MHYLLIIFGGQNCTNFLHVRMFNRVKIMFANMIIPIKLYTTRDVALSPGVSALGMIVSIDSNNANTITIKIIYPIHEEKLTHGNVRMCNIHAYIFFY
jgi:hypothetical protein